MARRGRPKKTGGGVFSRPDSQFLYVWYPDGKGAIVKESSGTIDREEAERFLRDRLNARQDGKLPTLLAGKKITFDEFADWFLEHRAGLKSEKTCAWYRDTLRNLRPCFGPQALAEISGDSIEDYLRARMQARRRVRMKLGVVELARTVSPKTVWHEFTALRAILNEAVRRKRLGLNPCAEAVFPARKGWRDRKPESHILTSGEEERVLACAPRHLRNVIVIMVEMGLRQYIELLSMKKAQVDLANQVVDITQSKTEAGKGLMPMTELAATAFRDQMELAGESEYVFPSRSPNKGQPPKRPYMTGVKTAWRATLRRAGVPYFRLYDLRHTFANRLGHGGVVPQYVSQLLRHKTTALVDEYSDLPLEDKRALLGRLRRRTDEGPAGPGKGKAA